MNWSKMLDNGGQVVGGEVLISLDSGCMNPHA
jgi:hypothetical protein